MATENGLQLRTGCVMSGEASAAAEPSPQIPEKWFREALFHSAIGVAITDRDQRFVLVNDAFCRITGYNKDELRSLDWISITHPEDLDRNLALAQQIYAGDLPSFLLEKRYIRRDGTTVWVRTTVSVLQDDPGKPEHFIALVEDISERKRAEEVLAEKELELRQAQRLAQIGSWQWDPVTDAVTWSEELFRQTGLDPKLPAPTFSEHVQFFTPESWEQLSNSVENTVRTGIPYELELDAIVRDGDKRVIVSRGEAVKDGSGRVVQLRGTIQDITERKRAEQLRRKSEEKFAKLFQSSPIAMTLTTAIEGRQIAVNDAYERISGRTRDEVIGRTHLELGHWDDPRDREKLLERIMAEGHIRNVECRFRNKRGELVLGLLSSDKIEVDGELCLLTAIADITEWKRAEQALRTSEAKLALHFEQTMFGVIEWDRSFRVNEWNPAAEGIFGYTREEALGRDARELVVSKELVTETTALFDELLTQSGGHYSTNENVTKNGKRIVCEWFNTPLVGEDGNVIGVMSFVHDITVERKAQSERKQAEEALRQSEGKFSRIFRLAPGVIALQNFDDGRFIEFNDAGLRASGYKREEVIGRSASELGMWFDESERIRVRQALLATGRVHQEKHQFRTKAGEVREGLVSAELIEVNGQKCILSAIVDLTEHTEALRALQRSEEKFSKAFQSSPVMKCIVRLGDQRYIEVNQSFERYTGYERTEIIGRTLSEVGPWTDPQELQQLLRLVTEGGYCNIEVQFRTKAGELRLGLFSGDIMEVAGSRCILAVAEDITERKRAEDALRENEEQFRTITDNLPGVVYQFYARDNGEWGVYFVHERCREVLGLSPEPLATWGERFQACISPEDQPRFATSIQQAVASGSTWECEARFIKPTGEEIYIRGISRPQRHENELVYFGILLDVTDRKRAERALRESETRLRLAAEAGRMYAFEWDPATDVVLRSAESIDILGLTPGTMYSSAKECLASMHPHDGEQYLRAISMLTPDEPSFRATYRFVRPDAATIWLEDRVRAFFDDRGSLLRIIGMTADITARKEAEQDMIELSGRLITILEEERNRVARELHDGVSQTLAIVSIELAQAAKKASDADLEKKIDKLYEKVQAVLSEVGHLSHQLHPSTLKHLGFSPAIRDLCREVSDAHGIKVEFSDNHVPEPVSNDVALCMYRVTQEALRNIAKHSHSKNAWVQLTGTPQELRLSIWDEGVGFDVEPARGGLGLVSMRERLRLVGGSLRISSHVSSGTRIDAIVPLKRRREFLLKPIGISA